MKDEQQIHQEALRMSGLPFDMPQETASKSAAYSFARLRLAFHELVLIVLGCDK